jgi:hypothetical protein
MKKNIIILFLTLLTITSCSRKVLRTEDTFKKDSVVETIKEIAIDTSKATIIKEVKTDSVSEYEITVTPVDSLKPISINGLVVNNGIISFKKKSSSSKHQKEEKVSQKGLSKATEHVKAKVETRKDNSNVNIDKKPSYGWILYLVGSAVVLYVLYRVYLKYSNVFK